MYYIKHPNVSIIILVKDALKYSKNCIKSLNKYTNNFELIIVDNASSTKTKTWLKGLDWLDYTLITNKENKGFSYGNNQGIKIAKYDYICFLNSDTLLSPNWLGKLMNGFKTNENIGIVGPSTCDYKTIHSPQILGDFRKFNQERIDEFSSTLKESYREIPVVGFCFVIKKEVFNKIGVFDWRRYGIACHEDIDFVWRAGKIGFRSLWCRASYVHHFGNRTTREMGLDPKALRIKNRPILERRKSNPKLYVENDVKTNQISSIKGSIPILMITYNRFEYTKQAIEAIIKNSDLPFKLFVYDNNSEDGTKKYLENIKDNKIEIYYSRINTGLIPPLNYFIDKFRDYRYIAKVDNDTVVSENWLSKLKSVLDEFPLLAVEANHFLMLAYNINENEDYYKHFYSVDFNGYKLYLSEIVGGTGTLIRTSFIDNIPEKPGTLSGWIQYQHTKKMISAFYTGVWIDRLDQVGTNKYKEPSDYPEYDKQIDKMRSLRSRPRRRIREDMFIDTYKKAKSWHEDDVPTNIKIEKDDALRRTFTIINLTKDAIERAGHVFGPKEIKKLHDLSGSSLKEIKACRFLKIV